MFHKCKIMTRQSSEIIFSFGFLAVTDELLQLITRSSFSKIFLYTSSVSIVEKQIMTWFDIRWGAQHNSVQEWKYWTELRYRCIYLSIMSCIICCNNIITIFWWIMCTFNNRDIQGAVFFRMRIRNQLLDLIRIDIIKILCYDASNETADF